jgi:hypothetical protein
MPKRFSAEQIVTLLLQIEVLVAQGKSAALEACRGDLRRRQNLARFVCPRNAASDGCTAESYYSIGGNSTHFYGTHVPVEKPSPASNADFRDL